MPTKRTRLTRNRIEPITPAEMEWLTGEPQEGANRFWINTRGAAKVERCRALIAAYAHLIPPRRMAKLEEDLLHWAPETRKLH